jgi:hypothetical protein
MQTELYLVFRDIVLSCITASSLIVFFDVASPSMRHITQRYRGQSNVDAIFAHFLSRLVPPRWEGCATPKNRAWYKYMLFEAAKP